MSRSPTPAARQRPGRQLLIILGIIAVLLLLRLLDDAAPAEQPQEEPAVGAEPTDASESTEATEDASDDAVSAETENDADSEAEENDAAEIEGVEFEATEDEPTEEASAAKAEPTDEVVVAARGPPGMPEIAVIDLPPEAWDTIDLILADGPFPYRKDGSTFQNREGYLPDEPRGYYREYTVETPGSPDRGARRIVGGSDGELYYTDDHYNSFSWVVME